MAGNILPFVALGAGAYFLMSSKGKKKGEAKPEDAKAAEDEVAGDVDDAIAEKEAQPAGGTPTIQPSGPPREDTVPAAEPEFVTSGMAGKGSYRVVKLSDDPPRFEAQITNDMQNYSSVGQFETIETAVDAAKSAGIETYGKPTAPPFSEPVVVDTGMAGKGAYRVVQLSEQPPVFQAEIGEGMDNYSVDGQFETEEAAIEAAKRAGIERFGASGR